MCCEYVSDRDNLPAFPPTVTYRIKVIELIAAVFAVPWLRLLLCRSPLWGCLAPFRIGLSIFVALVHNSKSLLSLTFGCTGWWALWVIVHQAKDCRTDLSEAPLIILPANLSSVKVRPCAMRSSQNCSAGKEP